jgi:hypothetical protein
METKEWIQFILFFAFLIIWTSLAYKGMRYPQKAIESHWGKALWKKSKPNQVRLACTGFFFIGILFLCFSSWQLSQGTFKWKGNPKKYGFSNFTR